MKSYLKFAAALLISVGAAGSALAVDIALVITNSEYDNRSRIRDGDRDLRDVLRAYDRDGYTVMSGRNLNAADMAELLADFEEKSAGADRVIIHFTGYVEPSAQNMRLVPSDMDKGSLVGAHYAAPSLDLLYELLDDRPGRSALLLATPTAAVGDYIEAGPDIPQGVLVMSGKTRTMNRFVAREFLRNNVAPASIRDDAGISVAGFVSDIAMTARDNGDDRSQPSAADNTVVEMQVWRAAAQAGTRAALQKYMTQYPNGLFVREAQARIAALVPQISPEEQIEKALNLTRAQRRNIQQNLTLLGFDTRGIDGIFGNGSRRAVTSWQRSIGFRESGFLDRAQIRVLEEAARTRQAELDAKAESDRAAHDREDLAFWQATGSSGNAEDLREYLKRYPDGLFADQAKRVLDTLTPQVDPRLVARENALNLNGQTRRLVEQRLAGLKLNPGRVDGNFDDQTRQAITQFQQSRGMQATGYLDSDTVGQLIVSVFGR